MNVGSIVHGLGACACKGNKTEEAIPPVGLDELALVLERRGQELTAATGAGALAHGMGALASVTQMTLGAAQALDAQLAAQAGAGCDDLKSTVRQLTFAFKAAFLSDPATQNTPQAAALNMSTPLAMTGFGPGTNHALSYVLQGDRTYQGQNITDSDGNCLTAATPEIPATLLPAAQALAQQVMTALQGATVATQSSVISQLVIIIKAFFQQVAALIQQATPTPPTPAPTPATPQPAPAAEKPASKPFPTTAVIAGGLLGVLAIGGGVLLYRQHQRRRAA